MGMFTTGKKMESLRDLFVDQIEDLYDAEKRLVEALPKMGETAHAPDLQAAFHEHLGETEEHVKRLQRVFELAGVEPQRETCDAMKGLISEGDDVVQAEGEPDVIDAALIAAAQRVEHYEIAGYGACRNFAQRLGLDEAAELIQRNLDEEGAADKKLTNIAEASVNVKAQ